MKQKMKNPMQRKLADKIKVLEGRLTDKMGILMQEKLELETKIKSGLMAKDSVYQDFYEA